MREELLKSQGAGPTGPTTKAAPLGLGRSPFVGQTPYTRTPVPTLPTTNPNDPAPGTMHIPRDVVDLIIDELASVASDTQRTEYLRNASLISTAGVDRSQHYLFSTITLPHEKSVKNWCSKTRPGPGGVSRHVRTIFLNKGDFYWPCFTVNERKTVVPRFTLFRNLRELAVNEIGLRVDLAPLDVLIPIFTSFAGNLQRLKWYPGHTNWEAISTLLDLLPNLIDLILLDSPLHGTRHITSPPLPRAQLHHHVSVLPIQTLQIPRTSRSTLRPSFAGVFRILSSSPPSSRPGGYAFVAPRL